MSERPAVRPVQPSLPELLEHATFLRRLAARLVGPDGADDVVQEAYATALAHPPARGSLRGWLAVVVANLARRERRSAARRATREERSARPEREDDATLALERLDLQRALSAFVVALPEEQRTVLYLRYFEALTPSAIAARLGVPKKTIESRHTRAIANLRVRLDERSGGDRAVWVSAIVAWAAPGGGSGVIVGGAVAAVVAVTCFGAWYGLRPGKAAEAGRAAEVASVALAPEPVTMTSAPVGERERLEVEPPSLVTSELARLFGTVRLRADGRPLGGATVRAYAGELGLSEVTTDAEGAFAFEWNTSATVDLVEVRASEGTTGTTQYVSQTLAPGASRELEFFVSGGATLAGRVLDESGAPVPGAEVLGWCAKEIDDFHPEPDRRVRAGSDGSFTIEHLGESFVLVAEAPGRTCNTGLRGELADGSRAEGLTLELAPALFLQGQVVDEQGQAIEGAFLRRNGQDTHSDQDQTHAVGVRRFSATRFEGRSGPDGHFEVGPSALAEVDALVGHGDFLFEFRRLEHGAENRLVLARGLTVSGRVLDSAGQPIEGARVRLGDCRGGRATTDAQGRWSIDNTEEAESAYLVAWAPGFAIEVREPLRILAGMPALRLAPEFALAGRILAADGRPIAGAKLLLEGGREVTHEQTSYTERTTWEWAAGQHRSTTDDEGRFRYGSLNAGEYALTVVPREDAAPGVPFTLRAGDEDLELVLDDARAVTFRGRVLGGSDRRPLTSFTITVMSPQQGAWSGPQHALENANGEYELTGFAPGRYQLHFRAVGHHPFQVAEREYVSGVTSASIQLHPAAMIGFELLHQDVSGATLTFEEFDGRPVGIGFGSGTASQLSLNPGPAVFAPLPQVPLRVTARAPRCRDVQFELDLTTPPDQPIPVPLEVDPEERARWFQLGVFVAADPAVRALKTLDELRVAFEKGELEWPRARIELEFLEADGTRYGHGTLEPLEGTIFRWSTTRPDEDGEPLTLSEEEQGPGLELVLPARVTTIRLSGAEVETALVEIEALLATEAPVVILAPRR
jgi:RNA polymerase sigma-70 factor (ECF subfamily)